MSFLAALQFEPLHSGSETWRVLSCDWRFTQITDAIGKPIAIPKGGIISVTVQTDGTDFLFEWMIRATMIKSGIITFNQPDTVKKLKTIRFSDSLCVGYHETFDYQGKYPHQTHLTISAREFVMGASTHTNNWPEAVYQSGNGQIA